MSKDKKIKKIKKKKTKKFNFDKIGVDIDKNEYREIVLSQSNHPDKINGK